MIKNPDHFNPEQLYLQHYFHKKGNNLKLLPFCSSGD